MMGGFQITNDKLVMEKILEGIIPDSTSYSEEESKELTSFLSGLDTCTSRLLKNKIFLNGIKDILLRSVKTLKRQFTSLSERKKYLFDMLDTEHIQLSLLLKKFFRDLESQASETSVLNDEEEDHGPLIRFIVYVTIHRIIEFVDNELNKNLIKPLKDIMSIKGTRVLMSFAQSTPYEFYSRRASSFKNGKITSLVESLISTAITLNVDIKDNEAMNSALKHSTSKLLNSILKGNILIESIRNNVIAAHSILVDGTELFRLDLLKNACNDQEYIYL